MIGFWFRLLFLVLPLIFFPKSSELFEFNKMVAVYIFTIIITATWAIIMIREKKVIFRRTILDIPLLLFITSQIISTIVSVDPRTSLWGYYSRFHGGLSSTLAYSALYWAYVSNMTRRDTQQAIRNTLVAAVIVAVWGVMEHFGHSPSCLIIRGSFDISCWVQDVQNRVFATLGQPNWMAAYIVLVIPLALAGQMTNFKFLTRLPARQVSKQISYGIFILLFAALLYTKSRSGLTGFGVSMGIFWAMSWWFNRLKRKTVVRQFLYSACLVGLMIGVIGTAWSKSVITKKQSYIPPSPELNITESGAIRKIVWKGAIAAFQAKPIFGYGVETFAQAYFRHRPVEHNLTSEWNFIYNKAHNEFLNYAATTGSVGLLAYLILIIFSLYQISNFKFRISKQKTGLDQSEINLIRSALLAGYGGILVTNFFGFSTVMTGLIFFLYPAMAVSLNQRTAQNAGQETIHLEQKVVILAVGLLSAWGLIIIGRYWLADYWYAVGVRANNEEDFRSADGALKRAINLILDEPLYHAELAQAMAGEGNEERAAAEIGETARRASEQVKILQMVANVYSDLGEQDEKYLREQIQVLEKLTQLAPTDAKTFYTLAVAEARAGETEKAKETLKETIRLKPDYEKAIRLRMLLESDKNEGDDIIKQ